MMKLKNNIKWFFVTNYGRYALGIILALTGVFSQYGTIPLLSTQSPIFEYTAAAGVIIIVCQSIYHVLAALFSNAKN